MTKKNLNMIDKLYKTYVSFAVGGTRHFKGASDDNKRVFIVLVGGSIKPVVKSIMLLVIA